jgi:hypothetical protein
VLFTKEEKKILFYFFKKQGLYGKLFLLKISHSHTQKKKQKLLDHFSAEISSHVLSQTSSPFSPQLLSSLSSPLSSKLSSQLSSQISSEFFSQLSGDLKTEILTPWKATRQGSWSHSPHWVGLWIKTQVTAQRKPKIEIEANLKSETNLKGKIKTKVTKRQGQTEKAETTRPSSVGLDIEELHRLHPRLIERIRNSEDLVSVSASGSVSFYPLHPQSHGMDRIHQAHEIYFWSIKEASFKCLSAHPALKVISQISIQSMKVLSPSLNLCSFSTSLHSSLKNPQESFAEEAKGFCFIKGDLIFCIAQSIVI